MKKILSFLLVILLLTSLVGCSFNLDLLDKIKNEEKKEISRGTIEGDTYHNEVLEIQFTKPESWVYYTDEEIASAMNIAVDQMMSESFQNIFESIPSVYDMMVFDTVTRTNIVVGYEDVAQTFGGEITEEKYLDAAKKQLAVNATGMNTDFSDETEEVKLGDVEFTRAICSTTANGVTMLQVYYVRDIGDYMAFVVVTIPSGYTVAEIEAMFQSNQ